MPVSPAQRAKRALVKLLHALALLYRLSLALTSDAADAAVLRAFRKVALKAHPDKGGSTQHTTELLAAKKDWDAARAAGKVGRPLQGERGSAKDGGQQTLRRRRRRRRRRRWRRRRLTSSNI